MNVTKLCRLAMSGIVSKAKRGGTRLATEYVATAVEELVTLQETVSSTGEVSLVARVNILPILEARMTMTWAHVKIGAFRT